MYKSVNCICFFCRSAYEGEVTFPEKCSCGKPYYYLPSLLNIPESKEEWQECKNFYLSNDESQYEHAKRIIEKFEKNKEVFDEWKNIKYEDDNE